MRITAVCALVGLALSPAAFAASVRCIVLSLRSFVSRTKKLTFKENVPDEGTSAEPSTAARENHPPCAKW
jgi:hypothetical protein